LRNEDKKNPAFCRVERLELLDLLQVFVGEIEDGETEDDTRECGPEMVASKEEHIDAIEEEPDTAPDEDEPDDSRDVLGEVAEGDLVHRGTHRITYLV